MLLVVQVTPAAAAAAARIGRGDGEDAIVMNTVLIENRVLLLFLLMAPLVLEVGLLLVMMMMRRKVMLADAAAVTLDCGGRVAVDGVLEALPRPVKVVLWHLIHAAAAAAAVASAVWLIHHPDATGVMLPLAAARCSLLPLPLLLGGGARVDLPQSSVKLQFRYKPEREERRGGELGRSTDRRTGRMGEGKEITVMLAKRERDGRGSRRGAGGRELGIIGIDNPHNVSVSE